MKIKIKKDAKAIYIREQTKHLPPSAPGNINWDWARMLEQVQGMTLEVETEYLFKDQFNTGPIPGVSEHGMRIMESVVEEVIDDERPGKARCQWCGKTSMTTDKCSHCVKEDYLTVF